MKSPRDWLVKMLYRQMVLAKKQRNEARDEVYRLRAELEQLRSHDAAPKRK